MQIVMLYTVGDDLSWHQDIIRPIELGSCEHAVIEFERACNVAFHERVPHFMFAGFEFNPAQFFYQDERGKDTFLEPEFLTVDEWFKRAQDSQG